MFKVSIHMKSGKTMTMICKEFSAVLNSTVRKIEWDGAIGYRLFTIDVNEIEAVTAKKLPWYRRFVRV